MRLTAPTTQIAALTGSRFFAALSVGVFHIPFVLPLTSQGLVSFDIGSLGVNFFFVLSGFVIEYSTDLSKYNTKNFLIRRMARVLPLHYVTFLIWNTLFFGSWGNSLEGKLVSGFANILTIHSLLPGDLFNLGFNAVSWSISCELFFYVIFALIRPTKAGILLIIGFIILMISLPHTIYDYMNNVWPNFWWFNPLARLPEFCIGIITARLYRKVNISYSVASILQTTILILILIILYYNPRVIFGIRHTLLGLVFAIIVFALAFQGAISRALSYPPIEFLGQISFSFYMLHHMVFRFVDRSLSILQLPYIGMMLAFTIVIILSAAFHFGIERPMRNYIVRSYVS